LTDSKKRYLQVPQGTEGVHVEEAYRHRRITQELLDQFVLWGYLPVETPVFDFYDIYEPLLHSTSRDVYRLIDREGDLLMLRSDITLFLAKQMGLWLREEELPARVCYGDTILRHQNVEDISKNEFFQIGAELIGKAGEPADLELLMLLSEIFSKLGLHPAVHLGSHQFLTTCLTELSDTELNRAVTFIRDRRDDSLRELLESKLSSRKTEVLTTLFSFIGTPREFERTVYSLGGELSQLELEELEYLSSLAEQLVELGFSPDLRIDLSEIGAQPYYTGIVFQAYLPGLDDAIASGGRYDKLLERFGFECPSVGFSMLLRKIEDLVDSSIGRLPKITKVEGAAFKEAFHRAQELRKKGEVAIL